MCRSAKDSLSIAHTHSIYLAIKHSDKVSIELALSFRFKIFKITITTFLIWYVCKVCTFVCESVLYFLFPKVDFIGFIFGIYLSFFFLLSRYRFCPLFRFIWNCMIWSLKFRRLRFVIHKSKITLLTWTHQLFEIVEILLNCYIKKNANIVENSHEKMHNQPKKTESCERYSFEYFFT